MRQINNFDEIMIDEIDGIDMKDWPDLCDAYCSSARWKDSKNELTENELDEFNSVFQGEINEEARKSVFNK